MGEVQQKQKEKNIECRNRGRIEQVNTPRLWKIEKKIWTKERNTDRMRGTETERG